MKWDILQNFGLIKPAKAHCTPHERIPGNSTEPAVVFIPVGGNGEKGTKPYCLEFHSSEFPT